MDGLGDLVARDRDVTDTVVRAIPSGRSYDYHRFATTAMKAGNFLRHHGGGVGVRIGIADDRVPESLLGLFGSLLLGATVQFDPPPTFDGRIVIVPEDEKARENFTLTNGGVVIVYGEEPADSSIPYFERGLWSENPTFPPTAVDEETMAIRTTERAYTHGTLLDAAAALVEQELVTASETVTVQGSLTTPAVLVAGVFAPLLAGGTIRLVAGEETDPETPIVDGTDRRSAHVARMLTPDT